MATATKSKKKITTKVRPLGDKVLIQKILQAVGENDQSMISASSPDALDLARRLQRAIGEHPAVAAGFKEVVV